MEPDIGNSSYLGLDESSPQYVSPDVAAKRFDLLIGPHDEEWARMHKFFTDRLNSDSPVSDIIRENFTYHESRLLEPSDRDDIKELQAANGKRYKALLDSRFKGVEDSLATKLTVMYFGLPVAPIEDTLTDIAMMMGMDREQDPLYNIKPPLHFLTAHDRRNWGKDSLKGTEAPSYPIPWPKTGEPTLGLRGGEEPRTEVRTNSDYIPETETHASAKDEWTYLYGFNGRIPFVPCKWKSYSLVLRQLLRFAYTIEKQAGPVPYTLTAYIEGKGPKYIRDTLPLTKRSLAAAFLQENFGANVNASQKDQIVLFVQEGAIEPNQQVWHWEPVDQHLQTDTVKIGRSLGTFANGPEKEAISYAYMAFPKTNEENFTIRNYCSQQFNAHFTATMDILFGKPLGDLPRCSKYNHALFRLYDKNNPNSRSIPIVYGAMGLPQWAMELLHPLNNPGACWMVECSWLNPNVEPIILPNYYPNPNPHLLAQDDDEHAAGYERAFNSVCEITTEAFDEATSRKLESVYVIEGDPAKDTPDISGIEVLPIRGSHDSPGYYGNSLGSELKRMPTWYLTLYAKWRPGHCRLFPDWVRGQNVSVEMPALTSPLEAFSRAIRKLIFLTNKDGYQEKDRVLLKETPCFDMHQVVDMDSPSYLITPDSTENDWFRIRQSITSPDITVSLLSKSEVDWTTCIDESNIWGVRLTGEDDSDDRNQVVLRSRDLLKVKNLDDEEVDPKANYPSSPVDLPPVRIEDETPYSSPHDLEFEQPDSALRNSAFQKPFLHKGPDQGSPSSRTFHLPDRSVVRRQSIDADEQDCDVGIWATQRPSWADHPPSELFEVEATPDSDSGHFMDDDDDDDDDVDDDMDDDMDDDARFEDASTEIQEISSDDSDDDSDMEDGNMGPDEDDRPENVVTSLPGPSDWPPRDLDINLNNAIPRDDREHTWATQPSLFNTNANGESSTEDVVIPLTAPPVEKIHRTTGNVPMYSEGLLTPTGQAKLQESHQNARNMLLKRTMVCYFSDCNFTCRNDEEKAMENHILAKHATMGCGFCHEPRFEHWNKQQRIAHMREKHRAEFEEITTAPLPGRGPDPSRQGQDSQREEPFISRFDRPNVSSAGPSRRAANIPPQPPAPAQTQPQPSVAAQVTLNTYPREHLAHPYRVDSPLAPTKGQPEYLTPMKIGIFEEKRNTIPRRLTTGLRPWHDLRGPRYFKDPPTVCPDRNCVLPNIGSKSPWAIWGHFKEHHKTAKLNECPFCGLSLMDQSSFDELGNRIWKKRNEVECIKHLECHVYALWDMDTESPKTAEITNRVTAAHAERDRYTHNESLYGRSSAGQTRGNLSNLVRTCHFFDKCGVVISSTSDNLREYRRHLHDSHPKEVHILSSDEEDDDNGDSGDEDIDGDHGQERGRSPSRRSRGRKTPPRPPTPGPRVTEVFSEDEDELGDTPSRRPRRRRISRSPIPDRPTGPTTTEWTQVDEDIEACTSDTDVPHYPISVITEKKRAHKKASKRRKAPAPADQSESEPQSNVASNASRNRQSSQNARLEASDPENVEVASQASRKRKSPTPAAESENEGPSDVASTVSRGRRSAKKPRTRPQAEPQTEPEPETEPELEPEDQPEDQPETEPEDQLEDQPGPAASAPTANTRGTTPKSAAGKGRGRARMSKTPRPEDDDYEDDGHETEDNEEEENGEGSRVRRRAKSPDWVKKLGPGDPKFDPDDDMYCSKCLRKVPKRRNKSPNRSPIGRRQEVEAHIDQRRCCGIRNGIGSVEHLPNRSGWIKGSDLPKKLGAIKKKFCRRYPTYTRTMYPINPVDTYASTWRSDPNNESNMSWWDIPWPPYEGEPPFPGAWEAPPKPWDGIPASRKRRGTFSGRVPKDPAYADESDSDSGDELRPDAPDNVDLGIDGREALKRPGSAIMDAVNEEPPAKKTKTDPKTPKRGKKAAKASPQPSRTSSRIRMQRASASPAPPAGPVAAPVAAPPSVATVPEDDENTDNQGKDGGKKGTKRGRKPKDQGSAQPSRASSRIRDRKPSTSSAISAATADRASRRDVQTPKEGSAQPSRASSRIRDRKPSTSSAPSTATAPKDTRQEAQAPKRGRKPKKPSSAQPSRASSRVQGRKASTSSALSTATAPEGGRQKVQAPKRGRKPKQQSSAQPSRASSRIRERNVSASPAPPALSRASAAPAPVPPFEKEDDEYDSSDPDL